MITDNNTSEELEDDEEYEKSFTELMYEALSPKIKQFITEYYGERFFNLNSETYLEIEKTIKHDFIFADEIPNVLYRYKTITDSEKFDEALENFIPPKTPLIWQEYEHWFDRDFSDDDDEDTFLEDSAPIDLTEDQKRAKEIIRIANEITDNTQNFAHFMKSGYEIIMKEAQLFLEHRASFDLSILSPKGFDELHNHLDTLIQTILEDLEALINGE